MSGGITTADRVHWRRAVVAACAAARDPEAVGKAKALKQALAGSERWTMPDGRPFAMACAAAFLRLARGWAPEGDVAMRRALAPVMESLADAVGDLLDGVAPAEGEPPAWTRRADLA